MQPEMMAINAAKIVVYTCTSLSVINAIHALAPLTAALSFSIVTN